MVFESKVFAAVAKDPKVWAVLMLAYVIGVVMGDIKTGIADIKAEHASMAVSTAALVGLAGTQVGLQKQTLNMQTQSCINAAGVNEARRTRCFATMSGKDPQ